jgi:maleylpyruvate isomerase
VTVDPLALLPELDRATRRVLDTATGLGDPATPSGLPGWTRGHVLTHIARNADSMVNLLTWARTGVVTPQYASRRARDDGIEAGAGRPLPELVADVRDSADRFADAAAALPAGAWFATLTKPGAPSYQAAQVPWRRLREVEVHHVDLAAGYGPADWPESFAHRVLHEVAGMLSGVSLTLLPSSLGHDVVVGSGGSPTVAGPAYALAAWLAGRSSGTGLTVDPPGPLPKIPDWM